MPANIDVNIDVHIDEHQSSLLLNTISKPERLQPEYTLPFEMSYNTRSQMLSASGCDKNYAPSTCYVIRAPDTMRTYIPDFSHLVPYSKLFGMTDELTYYKQRVNRKSSPVHPIIDTGSKSDQEKGHPNTTNMLVTSQKKFDAVRTITRGTIDRIKAVEEFVPINKVQRISAVEEKVTNMPPRTSTTLSSDVLHKKLLEIENNL